MRPKPKLCITKPLGTLKQLQRLPCDFEWSIRDLLIWIVRVPQDDCVITHEQSTPIDK